MTCAEGMIQYKVSSQALGVQGEAPNCVACQGTSWDLQDDGRSSMEGNCIGVKILWEEQGLQLRIRKSGTRPQAEGGMASDSGLFPSLASTGPNWGLQEEMREGARETETLRSESLTELRKEHKHCV